MADEAIEQVPLAVGPLGYIALVRLDVVPGLLGRNTARHRLGMAIIAAIF